MRTITLMFVIILVAGIQSVSPARAQYYNYYRDGSTFPLTPSDTLITIKLTVSHSNLSPGAVASLTEALGVSDFADPIASGFRRYKVLNGANVDSLCVYLRALPEIDIVNPCFTSAGGGVACMSDEIVATFLPAWSEAQIDSICAARDVEFVVRTAGTEGPQLIRCLQPSGNNTLRAALDLVEQGVCRYAAPNFSYRHAKLLAPNDQFYPYQWHHNNTETQGADMGSENAWEITTGSSTVTIAVLDDGFQLLTPFLHPEFVGLETRDNWDYGGEAFWDHQSHGCP